MYEFISKMDFVFTGDCFCGMDYPGNQRKQLLGSAFSQYYYRFDKYFYKTGFDVYNSADKLPYAGAFYACCECPASNARRMGCAGVQRGWFLERVVRLDYPLAAFCSH